MNSPESKYPSRTIFNFVRLLCLAVSKILWRVKFYGVENIPKNSDAGFLIVSNHQTYFDPFWITLPTNRKFRYMAWDKAFDWFLIGKFIRYLGAFPVSITGGNSLKVLKDSVKFLREGAALIIFPEGEREFPDGKLLPFKTGYIQIALKAETPILPVTIRGANKIWSRDMKFPRFRQVEIVYHPLIKVQKPEKKADLPIAIEKFDQKIIEIIESALP